MAGTETTGQGSGAASLEGSPFEAGALERFGLEVDPFSPEHDPRFLLRSKPLRRAVEGVRQALAQGARVVLVSAPEGAGKTALMDGLGREFKDGIRTASIHNGGASWAEMGQQVGEQLRLTGGRLSPSAMSATGGPVFTFRVIVDQAERLSVDAVKHFSAYLDLEGGSGQPVHQLQLVLLAAEGSEATLFRWLATRAHKRIPLEALDTEQIRRYVARRVQLAQTEQRQLFSSDALERICQLTDGLPGQINRLCRAALELAASRGAVVIDAETVGTAARRGHAPDAEAAAPQASAAGFVPPPVAPAPRVPRSDLFEPVAAAAGAPRAEVLESKADPVRGRSNAIWAAVCALLLGVIVGGGAFLYWEPPPPAPEPITQIIEVPVEVEKIVEVPVEVVKVVEVPAPPKAQPRPPRPRPAKIAKPAAPPPPAKPAPAPKIIATKKPKLGPIPPAAVVLDRAFAKARPGDHTRLVEIYQHGKDGARKTRTLKLSRLEQQSRTLTLGVVTDAAGAAAGEGEQRFLSIEKRGRVEDDRFGYRPGRGGGVESLDAGKGRDPFAGTSFLYDDFRVRLSDHFVIHGIERSRVEDRYFYLISAKPRYKAQYQRAEFVIDALDETLVEAHYFKGRGLRPYRVVQYPREAMEAKGTALVPMRIVSRNFETNRVDEARVTKISLDAVPDRKAFTLTRIQQAELALPNL